MLPLHRRFGRCGIFPLIFWDRCGIFPERNFPLRKKPRAESPPPPGRDCIWFGSDPPSLRDTRWQQTADRCSVWLFVCLRCRWCRWCRLGISPSTRSAGTSQAGMFVFPLSSGLFSYQTACKRKVLQREQPTPVQTGATVDATPTADATTTDGTLADATVADATVADATSEEDVETRPEVCRMACSLLALEVGPCTLHEQLGRPPPCRATSLGKDPCSREPFAQVSSPRCMVAALIAGSSLQLHGPGPARGSLHLVCRCPMVAVVRTLSVRPSAFLKGRSLRNPVNFPLHSCQGRPSRREPTGSWWSPMLTHSGFVGSGPGTPRDTPASPLLEYGDQF